MKLKTLIISLSLTFPLVSCIQEEAPNSEADIISCMIPGEILKAEPEIDNTSVTLLVKSDANITQLSPTFGLTPGATISPENGGTYDFTTPKEFTVTSQDRQWSKTYTVSCLVSGVNTEYHFENTRKEPNKARYEIFYDLSPNNEILDWASGNGGYAITNVAKNEKDYPTSQSDDGYIGKCAKLVTRSTGSLGALARMYIAAGNLFIGTFDALNAMTNALKATKFGKPFEHVPTYLSGYYKYKAGEEFSVNGKIVPGRKDQCDIYAIFYETDEKVKTLDGTNALDSPNLISVARITDQKETDEWTHFYLPFVTLSGKTIDPEKLKAGKYNISVVFSSSIRGDYFEGAVGSTLYIDEVNIISKDTE